jgi:hypothetical protein
LRDGVGRDIGCAPGETAEWIMEQANRAYAALPPDCSRAWQ